MKFILICLVCIIVVLLLVGGTIILWNEAGRFRPDKVGNTELIAGSGSQPGSFPVRFSIITWNLGYAGLGSEMDFFYEGGQMVRPGRELFSKYYEGIRHEINSFEPPEIFLFQEIDRGSKRSYHTDMVQDLSDWITGYTVHFTTNYRSSFVPVPWNEPMGRVWSGMVTASKVTPDEALRISTPGSHSWPKSLFTLQRCLLITRYNLEHGGQLVVVHLHLSAFEDESELREAEIEMLKGILLDEFGKGNFVIAGGDWNQNPPDWNPGEECKYKVKAQWRLPDGFPDKKWHIVYDPALPTNRSVAAPFDSALSETTLLDYFVISPNIRVDSIQTIDLGFRYSDHLPVYMAVSLER